MIEEKIAFTVPTGETLAGVLHHPAADAPESAVILCHGMDSHKNSEKLVYLGRALARRGVLALRFDFRYVGESNGEFADITYSGEVADLGAAYAFVQQRHPARTAILGSSMGGTVALLFAGQEPRVAALVTVAAPIHPEAFPRRVLTDQQLQQWRERGFTIYHGQRLNATLLQDLERLDVLASARKVTCPTLVIHGEADEVVPVAEARELHACLTSPKKLCILKGTDHRFSDPHIQQRTLDGAVDWLAQQIGGQTR